MVFPSAPVMTPEMEFEFPHEAKEIAAAIKMIRFLIDLIIVE
jgi:hypothetical protein